MSEEKPKNTLFLIILTALLVFAGPTYLVYALVNVLDLNYFLSIGCGFALFIVGMILLLFLMRKKIVT
jgi:hypothetical protein